MAAQSQMLALGSSAPEFSLTDADGNAHALGDGASAYLVMFICNHCPYVVHVQKELAQLSQDYADRSLAIYGINSNDPETYPSDNADNMKRVAREQGYLFPYLVDADQSVAKAYRAACTPDIYLFDSSRKLVYRGQLDGSRPGNSIPVDGRDIRNALEAVLAGEQVSPDQVPSIGCSIKWKPGNEPDDY
jgi:peroxiredoxin